MMMRDDTWPIPKFNAGEPKHLHAVGVIAGTFVQFERTIESMFLHHPAQDRAVPYDVHKSDFFALSEGKRIAATRKFYAERERDDSVKNAASNVFDFFDWAHDSRNKILHSERYPMGFEADPDIFYLIKRANRRDPSSIYMALDLATLRSTAESMREAIVRSAEVNIHARYRDSELSNLDKSMWIYAKSNEFPPLLVPSPLETTEKPKY